MADAYFSLLFSKSFVRAGTFLLTFRSIFYIIISQISIINHIKLCKLANCTKTQNHFDDGYKKVSKFLGFRNSQGSPCGDYKWFWWKEGIL